MDHFPGTPSERLVTPAEMARIMRVEEADVRAWIASGQLDSEVGEDGEPCLRVREWASAEQQGPMSSESRFTSFNGPRDASLAEDARTRRSARDERERLEAILAAGQATGVDIVALTSELTGRLAAVAPAGVEIRRGASGWILMRDVRGGGSGHDVAIPFLELDLDPRAPAEWVRDAATRMLRDVQDDLAEMTTDPWPVRGAGSMPEPHALLTEDGATVRMLYGDLDDPVLELEPLAVAAVIATRGAGPGTACR